jgi:hypothetical protein
MLVSHAKQRTPNKPLSFFQISDAIRRLEIEKGMIEGAPGLGMTQEVKKLRQACNKLRHQNRGIHSPGH